MGAHAKRNRPERSEGPDPRGRTEVDSWLIRMRQLGARMRVTHWVYLLASRSRRLYVGSTSDILRRLIQHRQGVGADHCRRYHIGRLVYFETARSRRDALARERQIKSWGRGKKIALIENGNLGWDDLARDWQPEEAG